MESGVVMLIADIEAHWVATGETLETIAAKEKGDNTYEGLAAAGPDAPVVFPPDGSYISPYED